MLYSDDSYLAKLRIPIFNYGIDSWNEYHDLASIKLELDIEYQWYRNAALDQGYDWRSTPFIAENLLQGYHFLGTGIKNINKNDVISVPLSHDAGGIIGNYYKALNNLGEINLNNEDFTLSEWENVTSDRIFFRDLSAYYVFFLAYRAISKTEKDDNYTDQRNYWEMMYNEEFRRIMHIGIGYDFNNDGEIDTIEKNTQKKYRLKRI